MEAGRGEVGELSPFFFLIYEEGAGILLGLFNVSESHVKVKLPLRRWQCLKGGSGRRPWRGASKGLGLHLFMSLLV